MIERRLRDVADRYLIAPAEVLQVADAALAALDACSPPSLYASALHARGLALAYLGRYEDSLPALHLALERVPADQPAQRIIVLRGLATACEHMSLLEDALNWATQAAGAARALGEGARLAEVGGGNCYRTFVAQLARDLHGLLYVHDRVFVLTQVL